MRIANRFRPLITLVYGTVVSAATLLCAAAQAVEFSITIENIASADGSLMIAVGGKESFEAAEGHATQPKPMQIIVPARAGSVRVTTDALPAGEYAVQVFHDVNGNGELDANFVGMPKEPWGFSNNARGNFGPPTFADTKVDVSSDTAISIRIDR
jgi:uncharacterized protein (DUF2141 family)